ncbi:unnamed protein product [Cuscuta campestris]|uniref:Uncharacterized protein n=1 Tax=Cuscuta campestris TaxID=132261 RepID=A0A484MVB3_9ASTE|nr:unnamed protein product [Cuscuta campestris]VFQ93477.1 unnamed protein product [Cuscuta campestris]
MTHDLRGNPKSGRKPRPLNNGSQTSTNHQESSGYNKFSSLVNTRGIHNHQGATLEQQQSTIHHKME